LKKILNTVLKITIPLLISVVVLYFTYKDYDFSLFGEKLRSINMWWIAGALLFSALSPLFRGLRWNLLLDPIGYHVPYRDTVLTVFTGYAANIIIPRFGEISRCAILDRTDHVPFSKGFGTLVAERFVDMILLVTISGLTILFQSSRFVQLFEGAGSQTDAVSDTSSRIHGHFWQEPRFLIWAAVITILAVLLAVIWRRLNIWNRIKEFVANFWNGFMSLRKVKRLTLFLIYSLAIWICYYLEMYIAFFSMPSTASIGPVAGLVCFVASSFAVLVPTPNGAGPWHFVVINMLLAYGVPETDAQTLALVLHTAQTFCYLMTGALAWIVLQLKLRKNTASA